MHFRRRSCRTIHPHASRTVQTPPFYLAPEPGNSTCFDAIACRSDSYLRAPKFDFARLWGRHLAARQFGVYSEKAGPNSQNCALSHDFHPEVCVLASDPRAAVDGVNAWCRFKQSSGGGAVNGCFQPGAVYRCIASTDNSWSGADGNQQLVSDSVVREEDAPALSKLIGLACLFRGRENQSCATATRPLPCWT